MLRKAIGGLVAALSLASVSAVAELKNTPIQPFDNWLDTVRDEARLRGVADSTLAVAFDNVSLNQKVLDLDNRQFSGSVSLNGYLNRKVNSYRIRKGQQMMREHRELLKKVEDEYAVQARFIVAFWGIETNFGSYTGNHDVIRSLATLAYNPRRGDYFREELMAALQILQDGHVQREEFKGSWAGAMGQSQFMPSNFIKFARDYNHDGRKDIWGSEEDVFASIANYLREHGWRDDHTWGRKVSLPSAVRQNYENLLPDEAQRCRALTRHTRTRSLRDWESMGVRTSAGGMLPGRDLQAALVIPEKNGQAYLVYDNFKGILSYNCSNYYALSVAKLSDYYR